MTEKTEEEILLNRLIAQVSQHLETRLEYITIVFTEKMSEIASTLAGVFTLVVFGAMSLFFFSLGFAWWLGDFVGDRAGGFALAGFIFLPFAWVIFWWVRPFVRKKIIQGLIEHLKNEQKDDEGRT